MNLSDEDNTTFQLFDVNVTQQPQQPLQSDRDELWILNNVIHYIYLVLGGPGNILSMIIWLRRHIISKNSSALYPAVLAISDLLNLVINTVSHETIPSGVISPGSWLWYCLLTVTGPLGSLNLCLCSASLLNVLSPFPVHCRYVVTCMCIIYDRVVNEFAV